MERPQPEQKSFSEISDDLLSNLKIVKDKFLRGEAELSEFLSLRNDIQRMLYNELKRLSPERYTAEYDDIAIASITQAGNEYSRLNNMHPVTQAMQEEIQQELEFEFWKDVFQKNYPNISLPTQGTASDIFKTVLRNFLNEYGYELNAEVIADIELNYILKSNLEPEDYIQAERKMIDDINSWNAVPGQKGREISILPTMT